MDAVETVLRWKFLAINACINNNNNNNWEDVKSEPLFYDFGN